jgi:uncharacterized protein YbjQ (UPF0145 family)
MMYQEKKLKNIKGLLKEIPFNPNISVRILWQFKTIVGGEIREYTQMMDEARQIAIGRMVEEAKQKGANAIVGVKLTTAAIMANTSEILAYGTAVVVEE